MNTAEPLIIEHNAPKALWRLWPFRIGLIVTVLSVVLSEQFSSDTGFMLINLAIISPFVGYLVARREKIKPYFAQYKTKKFWTKFTDNSKVSWADALKFAFLMTIVLGFDEWKALFGMLYQAVFKS